jgi:hypothetical protein
MRHNAAPPGYTYRGGSIVEYRGEREGGGGMIVYRCYMYNKRCRKENRGKHDKRGSGRFEEKIQHGIRKA